jgi:hypothetical protein
MQATKCSKVIAISSYGLSLRQRYPSPYRSGPDVDPGSRDSEPILKRHPASTAVTQRLLAYMSFLEIPAELS